MKKCLTCGMENSDDSLFCAGCGTRLPAAPEAEAAQEQNVAASEPEAKPEPEQGKEEAPVIEQSQTTQQNPAAAALFS